MIKFDDLSGFSGAQTEEHTHTPTPKRAPDHLESLYTLSQALQDHKIQLHLQSHTKSQKQP